MSEECTHDCSTCSAACSSREAAPQHDAPNPNSSVKKVIGVVSGKGGVGKYDDEDIKTLQPSIDMAVEIIKSFVLAGLNITMNQFNKFGKKAKQTNQK